MKSAPLSLRAAAAELDMSRKRLMRMIRDGLPATRRDERVYVNLEAARKWIAENETQGPRLAPSLHPDDPRWRERIAAAAISELKGASSRGELLKVDEVMERFAFELAALRDELFMLASRLQIGASASAEEVERGLAVEMDDVLSHLAADAPGAWPEPQPAPEDTSWLDDDDEESGETLPLLVAPDPRHAFAKAQAEKREGELRDLQAQYIPHHVPLGHLGDIYAAIRERVRAMPAKVTLALDARGNSASEVRRAIDDEVETALADIRKANGVESEVDDDAA